MALNLSKTGISTSQTIEAWHVTQSIDALTGAEAYNITISGSFTLNGGTTGSGWFANAVSSSRAIDATFADSAYITSSVATSPLAIALFNSTSSNNATFRFDNDNLKYQPSNNTLYVTNLVGTASLATTASYASTVGSANTVAGTIVPSGSSPITANLNFIAGATQTDASITPTATVVLPALLGKTLGQNCFVTIGVSGSTATDLVVVRNLLGTNLTFDSANANTDFYYHIIYT
jgi:hypothetical protein